MSPPISPPYVSSYVPSYVPPMPPMSCTTSNHNWVFNATLHSQSEMSISCLIYIKSWFLSPLPPMSLLCPPMSPYVPFYVPPCPLLYPPVSPYMSPLCPILCPLLSFAELGYQLLPLATSQLGVIIGNLKFRLILSVLLNMDRWSYHTLYVHHSLSVVAPSNQSVCVW